MADAVTITSTTDSVEDARAALGLKAETKPVEAAPIVAATPVEPARPIEKPAVPTPPPAPVADDDDDVPDAAEASEAGAKLAKLAKKSRFQSRIDELVRTGATSVRERDEAFEKIKALEAKIVALDVPVTPKAAPAPGTTAVADPPRPQETDFNTYAEYIDGISEWIADRKIDKYRKEAAADRERERAEREQVEMERAVRARQSAFDQRASKIREKYPDYDAVTTQAKDLQVSAAMVEYLRDAEMGPELHYYLSSNPEEALKLSKLSERATLVAMGRLEERAEEGRLNGAVPGKKKDTPAVDETTTVAPAKVPLSSAPPPAPVVGASVTIPTKNPDTMTFAEFKAWRAQQRKAG